MKTIYRLEDVEHEVSPHSFGDQLCLDINGRQHIVAIQGTTNPRTISVDGRQFQAYVAVDGEQIFVRLNGRYYELNAIDPIAAAATGGSGSDALIAPMPGVVVSMSVNIGDEVVAGQTLLTIESMKLQTAILAETQGVVAEIGFNEGETFDKGAALVRFETQEQ